MTSKKSNFSKLWSFHQNVQSFGRLRRLRLRDLRRSLPMGCFSRFHAWVNGFNGWDLEVSSLIGIIVSWYLDACRLFFYIYITYKMEKHGTIMWISDWVNHLSRSVWLTWSWSALTIWSYSRSNHWKVMSVGAGFIWFYMYPFQFKCRIQNKLAAVTWEYHLRLEDIQYIFFLQHEPHDTSQRLRKEWAINLVAKVFSRPNHFIIDKELDTLSDLLCIAMIKQY